MQELPPDRPRSSKNGVDPAVVVVGPMAAPRGCTCEASMANNSRRARVAAPPSWEEDEEEDVVLLGDRTIVGMTSDDDEGLPLVLLPFDVNDDELRMIPQSLRSKVDRRKRLAEPDGLAFVAHSAEAAVPDATDTAEESLSARVWLDPPLLRSQLLLVVSFERPSSRRRP
jgi:hypothetical protein